MNLVFILLSLVGVSYLITFLMLRFCLSKNIFDIPNSRSSHIKQTPRGGGVSIVLTFFIAVLTMIDLPKELLLPLLVQVLRLQQLDFGMILVMFLYCGNLHYILSQLSGHCIGWVVFRSFSFSHYQFIVLD